MLARRYGNAKRHYLIVNKKQAKHVPTRPDDAFAIMEDLGRAVGKLSNGKCAVIGFAETATSLGAVVASCLEDSFFLTTTREDPEGHEYLVFSEDHSHAARQLLVLDELAKRIDSVDTLVLVDDEISTGNTMKHLLDVLGERIPLSGKKIIIASFLNRMSEEKRRLFQQSGIEFAELLRKDEVDMDYVESLPEIAPKEIMRRETDDAPCLAFGYRVNPRFGVDFATYQDECERLVETLLQKLPPLDGKRVLVLGSEECMYPSLFLSKTLERRYTCHCFCHSSTRSPISVSGNIANGYRVCSAYEEGRTNYLYFLDSYDIVVVLTDGIDQKGSFQKDVASICKAYGNPNVFFVKKEGKRV